MASGETSRGREERGRDLLQNLVWAQDRGYQYGPNKPDHTKQGIKDRPGVWKLEVRVDSAGVSLHEKQIGIFGKKIRAYHDTLETIGISTDGLSRLLAKTLGPLVPYHSWIDLIEESCQI